MGREARRVASLCGAAGIMLGALAAPASAQNPGAVGAWSAVQDYPVVPVSAGVMPDGKIVAWDQANAAPWFGPVPHNGPAMVLTPGSGAVTRSSNEAPNTLFCSLLTSLPDGRLAVIGGGSDSGGGASSKVQVYDEDSRTFSVIGQMERTRWYPGGSLDAQGNPIVAGGTSTGIERIDASTGTGTLLETSFPAHWYADLIRTPDNRFAIEDVGDLQGGANSGRFMLTGTSLSSSSDTTLLKNRYRGIRTMIGPHKMLWSSGGTSRESMIIDASGASPTYSTASSSAFPHMTGQGVTLPTGDVLAVGGNSSGSSTIGTPVMTPELYKPASNSWSSMANMSRQRQYHSVAALLPDGRVWSAGTSWEGTQEANGQYFSPPYLFTGSGQPASRPTATDAPSSVKAGDSFSIATNNPSQIRSASMIRLAATTHQLNAGQAYVPLSTTVSPTGGRVQMTAPGGAQAPPGYYMVFLIDNNGVPSVAPIVRLRLGDSTVLPARAVQSSQFDRNWPASEAFDGDSGNTGGPSGSVSQTQSQSEPWWEVDLGEKRNVGSVTIQLRTDAGTNRDVWVYASDDPITSTTVSGARAQSGVTSVRMQTPTGSLNTVQLNRSARYLRVQAPGTTALSLAEVTPNYIPDTPSPTATAASPTQIDLSWADVAGETGYRLERSTSSSFTSPIGVDLPAGTTSYAATGLAPATTYYFRLRAVNGSVVSAWSSTVSAATPPDVHPDIEVDKQAQQTQAHVGDTVTYTFQVTNPGDTPLTVQISDPKCNPSTLSGPTGDTDSDSKLDPGETWTYSCSHLVVAGDGDPLQNTVSVTGTDSLGDTVNDTDTANVDIVHPDIEVDKQAQQTQAHVGDTVTYTFQVTNPGDTPLTVQISDPKCNPSTLSGPTGDTDSDSKLDPGETWTYSCSHLVVAGDGDPLQNTVSVTGTDSLGDTVNDTDTANVDIVHPDIEVDKQAQQTQAHVGDTVTYTFQVTNPGDTPLTVQISDPKCNPSTLSGPTGDTDSDSKLDPGETWTYSCSHLVVAGDGDPLQNTVSVTGTDSLGDTVNDTDTANVDIVHPDIEVDKQAQQTQAHVGDTVTYTFQVTNPGDTPLTVQISDPKCNPSTLSGPTGDTDSDSKLDPGETWTYSCSHLVVAGDGDPLQNTVSVTGTDSLGDTVNDTDTANVDIVQSAINVPPAINPPASPVTVPTCNGQQATIFPRPGLAPTFNGTSQRDVIVGSSAKDTINAGGGNDLVCAMGGDDKVKGGGGKDKLLGQGDRDTLIGGGANDTCAGGAGKDTIKSC